MSASSLAVGADRHSFADELAAAGGGHVAAVQLVAEPGLRGRVIWIVRFDSRGIAARSLPEFTAGLRGLPRRWLESGNGRTKVG